MQLGGARKINTPYPAGRQSNVSNTTAPGDREGTGLPGSKAKEERELT